MGTRDRGRHRELPDEIAALIASFPYIGVDEAGRGTWAGPLVAAAAAVPAAWKTPLGLTDSKKLTPKKRASFFDHFEHSTEVLIGIGVVEADEIDAFGIDRAQGRAQAEALRQLLGRLHGPSFVIVDGVQPPAVEESETRGLWLLPKADLLVPAVSLASVFAKETQARFMKGFDQRYPGYGFARSCGYGTAEHRAALNHLGPCAIHRRSYSPVKRALQQREAEDICTDGSMPWEAFDE